MKKKVLVTGGTGFLGSPCLPFLRDRGFEIHAVTPLPDEKPIEGVHWIHFDLKKIEEFQPTLERLCPTHLLHLAWYVEHGLFWNSAENPLWSLISRKLITMFSKAGGKRVVGAGTCAEYEWSDTALKEESTPCKPATLYGQSKSEVQKFCAETLNPAECSYAWGRLFHLYGPGEPAQRLVPQIINGVLSGEEKITVNLSFQRDFTYVQDAAEGFARLLDSPLPGPVNLASGNPVSLGDMAGNILQKMGQSKRVDLLAKRPSPGDPPRLTADTTKLRHELGWLPGTTLDQGLTTTIKWWREKQ